MMPQVEPLRSVLETRYADPSSSKPVATLARESVAAAPDLEAGAPLSDLLASICDAPQQEQVIEFCSQCGLLRGACTIGPFIKKSVPIR